MGSRKISVQQRAANHIAAIAWFIESKGMVATADLFVEKVYDFIEKMAHPLKAYPVCREPTRAPIGL